MEPRILICAIPDEVRGLVGININFSGVGKINAAWTTHKVITQFHPKLIINYGTAGTLKKSLRGLVRVTGFVDRDMDATPLGFELGQTPFEPGVLIGKPGLICGSGDTFATKKPRIGCDIVDMEAYAIAKICKEYNVDFRCYKYVTDGVNINSPEDWQKNLQNGCKEFERDVLNTL